MWLTRSLPCLKMVASWTSETSSQTSWNIKSPIVEIRALARWAAADISASASNTSVTKKTYSKLDVFSLRCQKVHISKSNVIELTDLDRGESYCFNVQAFISTRSTNKQLGELSQTQCSNNDNQSIFEGKEERIIKRQARGRREVTQLHLQLSWHKACREKPI